MAESYVEKAREFFKEYINIQNDNWELFGIREIKDSIKLLISSGAFTRRELQLEVLHQCGILIPNTYF